MDKVRLILHEEDVSIARTVLDIFCRERAYGETPWLMKGIAQGLAHKLGVRAMAQRGTYRMTLPVHEAIALRRLVLGAMGAGLPESLHPHARHLLAQIDPKLTAYIHIKP